MQINLEILGFAVVEDAEKCTALNEKVIVSDMMLRRRLTRNARISLYLADQLGEMNTPIVIGNAYGEVAETFDILKAIASHETLSPTAFQNSVHNTPASYLSIVGQNKGYVTTVSDLHETSEALLKVGALKSLSAGSMVLILTDAIDFPHIDELNRCGITRKECGVALHVRHTEQPTTLFLSGKQFEGYSPSVWKMLEIAQGCQLGSIIGVEI
ncbi:MAG: beta-ketoacyl synthase chain length factor [Sulfuricurvum sp.]|uniref:beta-ketoacyl synthase chain length factor n=1 Tax=Sulfuricurvum sp. TaxID=2025608 RepID=UPI002618DCC8|nr:beta-ketoacyl synthase chain length factor [Sulfuricurvum sp.]MDD2829440.1 beta-ketoacyl synthase chain length factor [Sulfuricurvum sp.]MDD4948477.1 beta-ketoacyl synthase chain length factor [Sulfuricurvum sp.]